MTTDNSLPPSPTTEAAPAATTNPTTPVAAPRKAAGLGPRWSYILTRGSIVLAVWAFFTFAFDPLLRFGVIQSSQIAVGAKVDVQELETSFFPPQIYTGRVTAANRAKPMTNLIDFQELQGDVDGFALLKGSYVVDKAVIKGLTWASPRRESGLLPNSPPPPTDEPPVDYVKELTAFGKDWGKNIMARAKLEYDPRTLETVRLADQMEDEWKSEFDSLEGQVKGFEGKIKLIKQGVDGAKKGDTIQKIESYTQVAGDVEKLLTEADRMRRQLETLPNRAREDLGELNEARKRDTAEIRRKINSLVLDSDSLSEFLLGPTLHHRVRQTMDWLSWANGRVDEFANPPKPVRYRGEDILFERRLPLPTALVRLVEVTGQGLIDGEAFQIRGTIQDITSDPKLHGKPVVVRMEGLADEDKLQLQATLDRTLELPVNDVDLRYTVKKPLNFELGDQDSFSIKVSTQGARWHAYLRTEGDQLRGRVVLLQDPARFEPQMKDNIDERLLRMIRHSMAGIDKIDASILIGGTVKKPTFELKTNLGATIARGIQDAIGSELETQQQALLTQLDTKAKEKTNLFVKQFNARHGDLLTQLNINEQTLRNLVPKSANLGIEPAKFEDLKKKLFRK